jgi:hypothetical protein
VNLTKFNTRSKSLFVAAAAAFAMVPGLVMAQAVTPGAALAAELSGGKADVGLIILACAAILGLVILWRHVRKAG